MSKFIIIELIEEKTGDSKIGTILAWVFLLWWVYLLYYMFIVPVMLIISGFTEHDKKKIIVGGVIILFYIVCLVISSISTAVQKNSFHFEGLTNRSIYYGEDYRYLEEVQVFKKGSQFENEITYSGQVDSLKLGDYTITYQSTHNNKTISKTIVVSVIPFYENKIYGITILEKIKVNKISDNSYKFTGFVNNDSNKDYKSFLLVLECVETKSTIKITFDGLAKTGVVLDCDFTSAETLNTYSFKVNYITCY